VLFGEVDVEKVGNEDTNAGGNPTTVKLFPLPCFSSLFSAPAPAPKEYLKANISSIFHCGKMQQNIYIAKPPNSNKYYLNRPNNS
jgi:hypothetical protein